MTDDEGRRRLLADLRAARDSLKGARYEPTVYYLSPAEAEMWERATERRRTDEPWSFTATWEGDAARRIADMFGAPNEEAP